MDAYERLASIYDEYWGKFSSKYYSFITRMITEYGHLRGDLLDLACGTGELIRLLSNEWTRLVGLDISQHMLEIARRKVGALGNVELHREDFAGFELNRNFDLILCCFDSINYATSKKHIGSCFERVSGHLTPGGFFVFDVINELHCSHFNGQLATYELAGIPYQVRSTYDEGKRLILNRVQLPRRW